MPDSPPAPIDPIAQAPYRADKMGKSTLFESPNILVGLNAFEPGQAHAAHVHQGTDKVYVVLEGEGAFELGNAVHRLGKGGVLVAPSGVSHGIANDSGGRLLVLTLIAPAPRVKPS